MNWPRLDGLRGLAILVVIAYNCQTLSSADSSLAKAVVFILDRGWIGVQLFFVLSGFLITGILLDTQRAGNYYRSFFARRTLRIFPLYYAALVVLLWVLPALGGAPVDRTHSTWWLWLYGTNWIQPFSHLADNFPHLWSLAVEEQFYLLWPFVLHRLSARRTLQLCLVIAALSLAARVAMRVLEAPADTLYMFTFARIDAMALGGAAAAWQRLPRGMPVDAWWQRHLTASAALVALAGAVVTHAYPRVSALGQTLGYSLLAVSFTLLVLDGARSRKQPTAGRTPVLEWRWLRAVGKYSYAMYIVHMPLNLALLAALKPRFGASLGASLSLGLLYLGAVTLASFALAYASYHLFERHFLRLKTRFEARPDAASEPLRQRSSA